MTASGKAFLPGVLVGAALVLVGLFFLGEDDESWSEMAGSGSSQGAAQAAPTEPVFINGERLREEVLEELFQTYGIYPAPGRWWYDEVSGLFGSEGQPSLGFMFAGHEGLGRMKPACSQGRTGVFLNGRQLPASEVAIFAMYFQTDVLPGRYWLDGLGNVGYEGNAVPLANLYAAAEALARLRGSPGAGGSGGDNFWSSRFSAGNWTADGSAGYVRLPGGGSVTYGM